MIIRFFKSSYFSRLLTLIVLILVLWLPGPAVAPVSNTNFPGINLWLQQLLAIIIFFLTVFLVNEVVTKHRLSDKNSYLTAFFFILIGSGSGFLTRPTPFLLAAFFFALFYRKLFDFQNSTKIIATAFDAGLFLGIASLFFPPLVLVIPLIWIALLIYQADQWRPYITAVLGLLSPWFFVFSGNFWFNRLPEMLPGFLHYFHFRTVWLPFANNPDLIMFLLVALTTFIGAFSLIGRLSSLNISLRQHALVSLWGLLFCSLVVMFFDAPIEALMLTALPASLIVGIFFAQIKKLKWANLFVLLWILFVFINHLLPLLYVA